MNAKVHRLLLAGFRRWLLARLGRQLLACLDFAIFWILLWLEYSYVAMFSLFKL
jgi:hypothetical protein